MTSYTLNLEALQFYDLSRIPCFILVGKDKALFVVVEANVSFQSVLLFADRAQRLYPSGSRAIALYHQQITFVDTGIDHRIAFGPENIKVSFAK